MTDEIPDDVVERAREAFARCQTPSFANDWWRAAGRVFVEWEREQCALAVEAMPPFAMEEATIRDAAAAIRSRKD